MDILLMLLVIVIGLFTLMKRYKTFSDLQFYARKDGLPGTHAELHSKRYGVSVLLGKLFYSNGVDSYELAALDGDYLTYEPPIVDGDVLGYLSEKEVTKVMKAVQRFEAKPL